MTVEIALVIVCAALLFSVWCLLGVMVLLREAFGHRMGKFGRFLCAPILVVAWIDMKLTS